VQHIGDPDTAEGKVVPGGDADRVAQVVDLQVARLVVDIHDGISCPIDESELLLRSLRRGQEAATCKKKVGTPSVIQHDKRTWRRRW